MKLKTLGILVALSGIGHAAVTINTTNLNVPPATPPPFAGLAIVDGSNNLRDRTTYFYGYGTFSVGFDFAVDAADVISGLTLADVATSTSNSDGLFNAPWSYNGGTDIAPSGIVGEAAYLVIGNAADLTTATELAVIDLGTAFISGDGVGNATLSAAANNPSQVVFGAVGGAPSMQPNPISNTVGVALVTTQIPEPAAAALGLIGLLGILRRRR